MYVIDTQDDAAEKLAEFGWEIIDRVAELKNRNLPSSRLQR